MKYNLNKDIKYYEGSKPYEVKDLADFIHDNKDLKPIILYTEPNWISNRLVDFYLMQANKNQLIGLETSMQMTSGILLELEKYIKMK